MKFHPPKKNSKKKTALIFKIKIINEVQEIKNQISQNYLMKMLLKVLKLINSKILVKI